MLGTRLSIPTLLADYSAFSQDCFHCSLICAIRTNKLRSPEVVKLKLEITIAEHRRRLIVMCTLQRAMYCCSQ